MTEPLIALTDLNGSPGPPARGAAGDGPAAVLAAAPAAAREGVLFLDAASTEAVYGAFGRRDLLDGDDGWGNRPFSGGAWATVASHRAGADADPGDWLRARGVDPEERALLLPAFAPRDEPAVLAPWRVVVARAADLFAGDDLVVVAASAAWCLHFHHDGALTFARDPVPTAPEREEER